MQTASHLWVRMHMQFGFRIVLHAYSIFIFHKYFNWSFPLCRQEISSKAIQVDFAANHPESGWLAHIRQFILQQHHSGQTFQLTIQILDG